MANPEHAAILRQGGKAWDRWRETEPDVKPDLKEEVLCDEDLCGWQLSQADLRDAELSRSDLSWTDLKGADLRNADLSWARISRADLRGADLRGANLLGATLVFSDLRGANLSGCLVYGVSPWDVKLEGARQSDLIVCKRPSVVTVDNLDMAQFIYLLLDNKKIRNVIDTIGSKGVLVLGRFTERKHVLEAIRAEVRKHNLLPIVFDFERPEQRDFSETVSTLAGMSRFIIADITKPKSVPLELELTVPNYMIPFVPIIQEPDRPFAMFQDLWKKYRDWVLEPLRYDSVDQLVRVFERAVLRPANDRSDLIRARKAEELVSRHAKDYE